MDIAKMYVKEIAHRERLELDEQARKVRHRPLIIRLRDRIRQVIGTRLIAWGERLYVPDTSVEARP